MSMTTEAVAQGMMRLALDAAALRHQALTANLANATMPGYVPVKVDFEARLAQARQRLQAGADLAAVRDEADLRIVADGDADAGADAAVAIDEQAAALAQNVVHYQALVRGWARRMSILAIAVNEGGRR
jgi:flagellar basal-body rod protein FlgB